MNIKQAINKLFDFSIVFVPGSAYTKIHSRTFNGKKSVTYLLLLIILVASVVTVLWVYTPLREKIPYADSYFNESDLKIVDELNRKVNYLIKELEQLKSTNRKLNEIISNADTINIPNQEVKKEKSPKIQGSIYFAFTGLLRKLQQEDQGIIFVKPAEGYISRGFDPDNGHYGIDFSIKSGSPIYAAANGYVIFSDFSVDDGFTVIIMHKGEYLTIYKHCSVVIKKPRERVFQGEIIALSGNTGRLSYGPHLHFEVWHRGSVIDPKKLIMNN